jgi:tetratricopeptide (TPR) repeat protein
LKSFRDFSPKRYLSFAAALVVAVAAGWTISAKGAMPSWISNIEAGTQLENAFFRLMALPYGNVLYHRPPAETRTALGELIQQKPADAELYSLRALEDEQQLDFAAAESDWKLYAEKAANKPVAQLALADFYHRRLQPQNEITVLAAIANAPADASENLTPVPEQRSWRAFTRIFSIIQAQGQPKNVSIAQYRVWIARYPKEASLYSRFLEYLVSQKEYAAANQLIAEYQKQYPDDGIFEVKAKALVEYRQGSIQQGLAVYEKSFQPLWSPELVKSYFDLLAQTQNLRKFLDQSRAALNANPEDLKAAARIFYYYQQQGKLDTAQQAITTLRLHKETANSPWTPQELYICGRLLEDIHAYPDAARYYFALYNSKGANDSQERALSRLTDVLLTAPETPIRLGAGELSLYKDIATMDQGPGYLNGILSLILNTTYPASAYAVEEQRAISYFHRSRAAELLAMLDKNFPNSASRPELHAKLLEFYASNAQSEAVLKGGKEFLAAFPKADERTAVALLMADADAHLNKTQDEFAIYDSILRELAADAGKVPLGTRVAGAETFVPGQEYDQVPENNLSEDFDSGEANNRASRQSPLHTAFQVNPASTEASAANGPRSPEYSRVLERYLARLVELNQIPQALGVLRREIDQNPDDPGLYERLAVFLQQNNLGAEQEEVYRRAMARFPDRSWYNKLARFYLRSRKNADFEKLTQDTVKQFDGSDLQGYFQSVVGGSPQMYLRLNQYAHARFPHNPYFVRNLLRAYHSTATWNEVAWEELIRQHWFEEVDLRNEYFEFLTRTGKLEAELKSLREAAPADPKGNWQEFVDKNPAAGEYLAQAEIWRSHFEESAPVLKALAATYPAEPELERTAFSVYRSLAYLDPSYTSTAVQIETNLLAANPGSTEILARIGDIYSDRDMFAQAVPYWERIPKVAPGESGGFLEAATIYWDYFDFDNALRLLNEGRATLGDQTLYGYEEGAIYEGKRDYTRAIQEYTNAALAAGGESPALNRLLDLSRRPKYREQVNQETEKLTLASHYSLPAVHLRVRVLEAENRQPELIAFLDTAVANATTIEQASELESLAQQKSLEDVRQRALEKQAALATDPVTRLQLRYALVRLYENRKDFASAQRNIEALYRDSPKILGVVRATVDFYWRVKLYPQAIQVLEQAAKDAYPALGKQFTFEAARKSTEARQYPQARDLLAQLLKDSPYDSQFLAAMADTYAEAGDEQALKQFYLDKIALFRNAPLSADERKTRIAALRRGLISALTKLNDYSGAVDQYIELINNFPEDEGLVTEAALYSQRYKRQGQLLDFYAKTIQQSPRDFRWPMVQARIQTNLEDFPAAIDSYGKAIAVRPDRTDLRIARAALDERLMHFDEAAADYERIYQLAYKDPKWMEKVAEVRARQGRSADAVAALKVALIDVGPERAQDYFEVARRLEGWGILQQARDFAEQGVNLAAGDLLASTDGHDGAKLYVRIMTRLRQQDKAYTTLRTALTAASSSLPVVKEQVAKEGIIAAISDREWREHTLQIRIANARTGMAAALSEMGTAVAQYFTPEEKVKFADFAQTVRSPMNFQDANLFAIPLVHSAGLAEQEALWRYDLMMHSSEDEDALLGQMSRLVELQRQRIKFAEMGSQLETFAPRIRPQRRSIALLDAAEAYRAAGDSDNELRVLSALAPSDFGDDVRKRYFALLLTKNSQRLVQEASAWTPFGQQAADFAIANGSANVAHDVVTQRGRPRPPVWGRSYTALVGLYFAEPQSSISAAFVDALGDQTIGNRIGKPLSRGNQLAGDVWYYYGSRYGEYLADMKQDSPEDFLPAELEHSPASSSAYETLADFYISNGDARSAIADYNHTLELSPGLAAVHDRLALAYFKADNKEQAIAQWKLLFSALLAQVNSTRVPESFWADFGRACDHLHSHHVFAAVKPEADAVVRAYLRRNGNYRSNALLHSVYAAIGDPPQATSWLLDVSSVAPNPSAVLADLVNVPWIPLAQRGPLFQRILDAKQTVLVKAEGLEKENAQSELRSWQNRWIRYLIDTKQFTQAGEYLASLPQEQRIADAAVLVPMEMRAAAQLGTLDAKLEAYQSDSQSAPAAEPLRAAARELFETGDKRSARKILEFVFARGIEEHQLVAANFLGLAEIRIADGDTDGAIVLLNRLVLVVGDPYQNLDSAAALLEKTGHPAEALEFLTRLVKATPWEPAYRLRLAKAQLASAGWKHVAHQFLTQIASAPQNPYSLRLEATSALSGIHNGLDLGSAELNLLAGETKTITAAEADHPFFYDARLKAAQNTPDPRAKIQIFTKALADTPAREDARIPLFQAAVVAHEDEFALASIEQMLRDQRIRQVVPNVVGSEEEIISDDRSDADQDTEVRIYAASKLSPAQQAQIAREVGLAFERLKRLGEALAYMQVALNLEKTPPRKKEIVTEIADVKTKLRRQQLNAARQPILHADLEQDRLVRPRVVAKAAPAAKLSGKPGERP